MTGPLSGAAPNGRTTRERRKCEASPILLFGASTGGVAAIEAVLGAAPDRPPPIVIAQHMPAHFLASFVARLDASFALDVRLVSDGELIGPGDVRLARAEGLQTSVDRHGDRWRTELVAARASEFYCPSVDHLFISAVAHARRVGAAVLTGLGRDGTLGLSALRAGGAATLVQTETSSVAAGMPRAARVSGGARGQADPEAMIGALLRLLADDRA